MIYLGEIQPLIKQFSGEGSITRRWLYGLGPNYYYLNNLFKCALDLRNAHLKNTLRISAIRALHGKNYQMWRAF